METTFRWLRLSGILKQGMPKEKSSSLWNMIIKPNTALHLPR